MIRGAQVDPPTNGQMLTDWITGINPDITVTLIPSMGGRVPGILMQGPGVFLILYSGEFLFWDDTTEAWSVEQPSTWWTKYKTPFREDGSWPTLTEVNTYQPIGS